MGYTGDGVVMSYVAANALADLDSSRPIRRPQFTALPFVQHRGRPMGVRALPLARHQLGLGAAIGPIAWKRVTQRESRAGRWLERLLYLTKNVDRFASDDGDRHKRDHRLGGEERFHMKSERAWRRRERNWCRSPTTYRDSR